MAEFHFKTPLTEADVRKVSVGDSVYLDGIVFGLREAQLIRLFDRRVPQPVNWRGSSPDIP